MSDTEKLALAKDAVAHVLNAIADDPRKYYLLGPATGSFDKLTKAAAALFDEPLDEVRRNFRCERERYERYLNERLEDERLIEIGRQHGTEGGA